MKLRRAVFEALNAALRPFGLCLERTEGDFQTSVPESQLHDLIVEALTDVWGRWYDTMSSDPSVPVQPRTSKAEYTQRITAFLRNYRDFAGKNMRSGGLYLNNTISLFAVAAYFDPDTVVDSGTFTGNSAWALSCACPEATIHSFDITHVALRHRASRVTYHLGDWAGIIRGPFEGPAALGFFDDHVDQVQRLEECAVRNVRYVVFDDDTPVNATHNGHNTQSFPKVTFVFSKALRNASSLTWRRLGKDFDVAIDHDRLLAAQSRIAHYSRLPDLYPVTGFTHQWPLSLVILKGQDALALSGTQPVPAP